MKTFHYEFELTIKAVSENEKASQVVKVAEVNQWGDIFFENPTGSRSAKIAAAAAEKFSQIFEQF